MGVYELGVEGGLDDALFDGFAAPDCCSDFRHNLLVALRLLITEFVEEDSPFCLTRAITRTMIGPFRG